MQLAERRNRQQTQAPHAAPTTLAASQTMPPTDAMSRSPSLRSLADIDDDDNVWHDASETSSAHELVASDRRSLQQSVFDLTNNPIR